MKKRLLALALCLVLATSLLPIPAAADTYYLTSVTLTADGVEEVSGWYKLKNIQYELIDENIGKIEESLLDSLSGWLHTKYYPYPQQIDSTLDTPPEEGKPYYVRIGFGRSNTGFHGNSSFSATLEIPGYTVERLGNPNFESSGMYLIFKITKNHEHAWQFTQTENTLTATCKNCDTPPVTLSLSASSVTLPESPFNARLEGLEQFMKEVPNAVIGDFVYKYKGPGDSEYRIVEPTAANAKAGEYQVGVRIKNLPGPVESDGPVAMAFGNNQDGTWYADLYVKYTAADPAITAQTGDNRPIELMMGIVVVFSALAAAAFVLDSKRKYSR